MPPRSAGIVAFRSTQGITEVLLVHPGGPFWRNKDIGAWSIPKGEYGASENPEEVARREFLEELGIEMTNDLVPLGEVRQRGGKMVTAFAAELDVDVQTIRSNTFEIEWPPRSGRRQVFPEVDRVQWFDLATARSKIIEGQKGLLDRLERGFGKAAERSGVTRLPRD
jgi:predicted NUDIX family NTP pyrophosphohydrolase